MHDDQIRSLLRTLEHDRMPDPAFADALYHRLHMVAGGRSRSRAPFVLLAAALLAILAASVAIGSGLLRLPETVDASGSPLPSTSGVAVASPTASATAASSASAPPSAEATPQETVAPDLAGRVLFAEADGLRLRSQPSPSGDPVATLRRGQLMGASGATATADGMTWYEVVIGPGPLTGWVAGGADGAWLRLVEDGAIAYSARGYTQADLPPSWVLVGLDGDVGAVIAGEDATEITWSPDGTRFAIGGIGSGGQPAVSVAAADGGDPREIGPGGYGSSWSPDGTRLAWSIGSDVIVTDEELTPRELGTNLRNIGNPMWSPDGSRLAVVALDCPECPEDEPIVGDVPTAVYMVDVASGSTTKVTDPGYYDLAGWSPDGVQLSMTTYDLSGERPQQAYVLPVNGRGASALLDGNAVHAAAVWSPDGTRLAVATPEGLVVMAGLGDAATLLVPSDAFVGGVRWSPSGAWLSYQTADGGDIGLWVVPADGSETPRRLTSTDISASEAEWQPVLVPLR